MTEARAIEGAGAQIADLYERHVPAAGRLAFLLTGDRVMAEDLVQDAFVRVIGRLGTFAYRMRSRPICAGRS